MMPPPVKTAVKARLDKLLAAWRSEQEELEHSSDEHRRICERCLLLGEEIRTLEAWLNENP
jgi:hypothetical protein